VKQFRWNNSCLTLERRHLWFSTYGGVCQLTHPAVLVLRPRFTNEVQNHDQIEPRFYWPTLWQRHTLPWRRPIESQFNVIVVLNFVGEFGPERAWWPRWSVDLQRGKFVTTTAAPSIHHRVRGGGLGFCCRCQWRQLSLHCVVLFDFIFLIGAGFIRLASGNNWLALIFKPLELRWRAAKQTTTKVMNVQFGEKWVIADNIEQKFWTFPSHLVSRYIVFDTFFTFLLQLWTQRIVMQTVLK